MDAIKIIKEHGVVPVLGLKDPDTAPLTGVFTPIKTIKREGSHPSLCNIHFIPPC